MPRLSKRNNKKKIKRSIKKVSIVKQIGGFVRSLTNKIPKINS